MVRSCTINVIIWHFVIHSFNLFLICSSRKEWFSVSAHETTNLKFEDSVFRVYQPKKVKT